jgi:hypothetical protein
MLPAGIGFKIWALTGRDGLGNAGYLFFVCLIGNMGKSATTIYGSRGSMVLDRQKAEVSEHQTKDTISKSNQMH